MEQVPDTRDAWADWVSASATRNHIVGEPLLDWLNQHGESKGYKPDRPDPATDAAAFRMRKGEEFEDAVIAHMEGMGIGIEAVLPRDANPAQRMQPSVFADTAEAMRNRAPMITQGGLLHADSKTYGFPDVLVRSDVLAALFPDQVSREEAAVGAPRLGLDDCHYRVIDIKYSTLRMNANGALSDVGSGAAYKAQVAVYNRALGEMQGYTPPEGFLLGRGWEQSKKDGKIGSDSCMDRLASVSSNERGRGRSQTVLERADSAAEWVRRVRREGADWDASPSPSVPELRPNAKGEHGAWKSAVGSIACDTQDLTLLPGVGVQKRDAAVAAGVERWTEPGLTPQQVGVNGPQQAAALRAVLQANTTGGPPLSVAGDVPDVPQQWETAETLEFFVDFETVSNLDDDFSAMPHKGGNPLVFMVGCGHMEDGEWQFRQFTADALDSDAEAVMLAQWMDHMDAVTQRVAPGSEPECWHWTQAEPNEYQRAADRHGGLPRIAWRDGHEIFKQRLIVADGAFDFGLKSVSKALHGHGMIETVWETGPADGAGAMAGAWHCQHKIDAAGGNLRLIDMPLMQEIASYNHVDCKAMMETIERGREAVQHERLRRQERRGLDPQALLEVRGMSPAGRRHDIREPAGAAGGVGGQYAPGPGQTATASPPPAAGATCLDGHRSGRRIF